MNRKSLAAAFLIGWSVCMLPTVRAQQVVNYKGWCDASAAVALDAIHFVVANDERNELLIFRRGEPTPVVPPVGLAQFLDTKDKESDLEGAARIGQNIYWISSHGRNKDAKVREARHRFFSMEIIEGEPPSLKPVGKPYAALLQDLLATEALKPYDLTTASTLAPEADGGLNIEGLTATTDGKLLIAFRSPVRGKMALVVPLENPGDVINNGAKAKIGQPIPVDLGGAGIRSIELIGSSYYILSGPPGFSSSPSDLIRPE